MKREKTSSKSLCTREDCCPKTKPRAQLQQTHMRENAHMSYQIQVSRINKKPTNYIQFQAKGIKKTLHNTPLSQQERSREKKAKEILS